MAGWHFNMGLAMLDRRTRTDRCGGLERCPPPLLPSQHEKQNQGEEEG
jgi:hypothetical protein